MLRDKINTYRPTIDPEYSENGQELGINLISNVKNPAVKIRGVAFSNHEIKELRFKDDLKLRIAAPVLVPSKIYRNDEDEKYYMEFTPEDIEVIAKDFMSKLGRKAEGVFNLEHEDKMVDSYIFEAILVDSEVKVNMIKSDYGIEVPKGTFFLVQQFSDKKVYEDIVRRDAIAFSFEGFMGTKLVKEYKFKNVEMSKNLKFSKMKNPKKIMGSKRVLKSASRKMKFEEVIEEEDLVLVADDFKEGSDIVVIEDVVKGAVEDFSGEVDVTIDGKEEVLIIEEGIITEVVESEVEEGDIKEEEMEDEKKETEIEAEDESEKEVKEEEMEEEAAPVEESKAIVDPTELEEIYKMLAEIKSELADLKSTEATEEEVIDEVLLREQKYANALSSFNKFSKKR